jgi:signal transduction histidine kinase
MALDLLTSHEIFKMTKEEINFNLSPRFLSKSRPLPILPIEEDRPMELMDQMIDMRRNDQIKDALEIVEAMKQSCEAAVCTLNDVLLYDKIEGGTMVLEKRQVSVIKLLSQTIQPFMIQVLLVLLDICHFIY